MEKTNDYGCGHISAIVCNSCMTKELASVLMKNGLDTNATSHIVREVKREVENTEDGIAVCVLCNENLVSLCPQCFSSKIQDILYSHFSKNFSDRLVKATRRV